MAEAATLVRINAALASEGSIDGKKLKEFSTIQNPVIFRTIDRLYDIMVMGFDDGELVFDVLGVYMGCAMRCRITEAEFGKSLEELVADSIDAGTRCMRVLPDMKTLVIGPSSQKGGKILAVHSLLPLTQLDPIILAPRFLAMKVATKARKQLKAGAIGVAATAASGP